MALDPALQALYTQSVTIEPWTGRDLDQKPTYGAGVAWTAYVVLKNQLVRDRTGQSVASRGQAYLVPQGSTIPSDLDRVTLPAGYVPLQPPLIAVEAIRDDAGDINALTLFF